MSELTRLDELGRLRNLVGPSEVSYRQLRDDLDAASLTTRESMLAVGALRGQLAEMSVSLARARQDQDTMQRRKEMRPIAYLADLAREYWTMALRPLLARSGAESAFDARDSVGVEPAHVQRPDDSLRS